MVPTPKNHFKEYPFVDREGYIRTFKEAVNNIGQKESSILVYYGIAGIGKTSLRKKLSNFLEEYYKYSDQKVIWTSIDLQLERHREKTTFLVVFKNELQRKYKIKFPAFEIAHAIYWKKANPESPLREGNYLFFEGDDAFDDFFGLVDKIPYFQVVPATARLLKNAPDYLRKWWKKKEPELSQLSEKEPLELEKMLPYFWAQDLNNYLERTSRSAVLFIDTYEALWEKDKGQGNFNARDEWIRELISNLHESSLWVICGREKIRWNEVDRDWNNCIEQYEIEKLPKKNALDFLNRCGIKEEEIQKVILKGSEGVPYYLELAVDTYTEITKTGSPVPDNFARTRSEIFDRFMKYLSVSEQETLKILSTPRFWNKDIFNALIEEYKTGYPLTAFSELKRFSFVQEAEGKLLLHPLIRESLQVYQDQKLKEEVHSFMRTYYSDQLKSINIRKITAEHENALTEAFYHAKESMGAENLFNWFISASDPFDRAAFWQLITPLYEEMLQIIEAELGPKHPDIAIILDNLAGLYESLGDYEKALLLCQRALEINEQVLGLKHSDVAITLNNLALLYSHMGGYEEALPLFQRALEISEENRGFEHLDDPFYRVAFIATTLDNLAGLYYQMGDYEKALPLCQRSLKINEKIQGPGHIDVAVTLNNLAELYESLGDYEKALPLFQRALKIREEILGPKHPDVATSLNNIAGLYYYMGDYEKALLLYQGALKIREEILSPKHSDIANSLNNIASLYAQMGDYEKALLSYQRALDISKKALGPQHPNVAITLNNIATLYCHIEKYEEALPLFERSLEILNIKLGSFHPYFKQTEKSIEILKRFLRLK
jgi:tetratricopeptide (TPR) repeat protein